MNVDSSSSRVCSKARISADILTVFAHKIPVINSDFLRPVRWVILLLSLSIIGCLKTQNSFHVSSPDGSIRLQFALMEGVPEYMVSREGREIITPSTLGFSFKNQPDIGRELRVVSHEITEVKENWERVWGQSKQAVNHYKQLKLSLRERSGLERRMVILFRIFDDGVAFRYHFPEQENFNEFEMTEELSQFNFPGDPISWWTPQDFDSYESLYQRTPLSQVKAVNTPITLKLDNDIYVSLHEAALTNYAGMTLEKRTRGNVLQSALVPWEDGVKVRGEAPFSSPWRTIQITPSAADLINSPLIENLNEPNMLADTSWIKPMKYIGIWWGMHMRKYTWVPGPDHGATTENTQRYIDFAHHNGLGGVLVEGWNKGWETWHTGLNLQDFTSAYDDFDLPKLAAYAKEKGLTLVGHHETGGNIPDYERQVRAAFSLYQELGVSALKTGYAGKMIPERTFHHGQKMVNHYRQVLELAAEHKIMLNVHEPIKPTGIRRTFPNMMTREGGRGMEWNGWSVGNPPSHTLILPFTRLLAGPMDYTPGIFDLKFDPQDQYRVHTTLARQLAHYVILYSPMQMAADMIENYQDQPAFAFVRDVPADWDETKVLHGEIGKFISTARRRGDGWFVGSATDEEPRALSLSLDFLDPERVYLATLYTDASNTDFALRPGNIDILNVVVKKGDRLTAVMASGGGHAMKLVPIPNGFAVPAGTLTLTQYEDSLVDRLTSFQRGSRYGDITKVSHLAVGSSIALGTEFDRGYNGGGLGALVDGVRGMPDYNSGWQGYRKENLDAVIDLGNQTEVNGITVGFLQSILHSILLPTSIEFSVSTDGLLFSEVGSVAYTTVEGEPDYQRKDFSVTFDAQRIRYVRVRAKNLKALPSWHIRAGQETFIFADEIQVF